MIMEIAFNRTKPVSRNNGDSVYPQLAAQMVIMSMLYGPMILGETTI